MEEPVSSALNLKPAELLAYQGDMQRAKRVRHVCMDCWDIGHICARHSGACIGCGSDAVVERDEHVYADGVAGWWCAACTEPETLRETGDPMRPRREDQ